MPRGRAAGENSRAGRTRRRTWHASLELGTLSSPKYMPIVRKQRSRGERRSTTLLPLGPTDLATDAMLEDICAHMPRRSPLTWTLAGFLDHFRFVHNNMPDHAYAWVLGAGASKSSGIPLAGELVQRWLGELHRRSDTRGLSLAEWATAENLEIPNFEYHDAASYYPRVYERRFAEHPDEGFAYLEELMSGKDPSPGYSILAQILDKKQHKICISTNFDNLMADALSIYTSTFPLVIGHESLAGFVKVVSRRPVICKIHRDLLLGPKNDTRSLRRLHESWAAALRALFSQFTPLFIGYGGNDDSLMDLLGSLEPEDIKGQMVWCYYERSEPSNRIRELVREHDGVLVPVPDFDLLMLLIGDQIGIEPIDESIEERAQERARRYRQRLIDLDTSSFPSVRRTLQGAFERAGGALVWRNKARIEPSTDRREEIYRQGREIYPEDKELLLDFASFLYLHERDLVAARAMLKTLQEHDRELEFVPSYRLAFLLMGLKEFGDADAVILNAVNGHAASLPQLTFALASLREAQGDFVDSERLLDSWVTNGGPVRLTLLGDFYWRRGRLDEAERAYRRAFAVDPNVPDGASRLANFLWQAHGDVNGGGKIFRELIGLSGVTNRSLLYAASYFLSVGDLRRLLEVFALIDSRPMDNSLVERRITFLRVLERVLSGKDGNREIEKLCRQMKRPYLNSLLVVPAFARLMPSIESRIPVEQRDFLMALGLALEDADRLSSLSLFPQWQCA